MLGLYSAALSVAVRSLLVPYHRLGLARSGYDPQALAQWLGDSGESANGVPPDLLLHAVSAGEMAAARPILEQLLRLRPATRVLLSSGTASGLGAGRALRQALPTVTGVTRLPWDRSAAVGHWLDRIRPGAVAVVETELWPNLFEQCRRRGIPLLLLSARIYPKDLWSYRLIRGFMGRVLDCASLICVQDETERQRFLALGADPGRLRILGNSKFAAPLDTNIPTWRITDSRGERVRLMVAASTHAPEEAWLLDAFSRLRREFTELRLVLAPRHVERADSLAGLTARRGWRSARYSRTNWPEGDWEVLILDRLGELNGFFANADLVIMGGSLARRGGHNFVEPARFAKPILIGPHMNNFKAVAERFLARNALWRVSARAELAAGLGALLGDPAMARDLGLRARQCAEQEAQRSGDYGRLVADLLDSLCGESGRIPQGSS